MNTISTKADVNAFILTLDQSKSIPVNCSKIVKLVEKTNPDLYDKICEAIEGACVNVSRYGGSFCATLYCKNKTFSQISYEASRLPKSYAFVCILKQWLPE